MVQKRPPPSIENRGSRRAEERERIRVARTVEVQGTNKDHGAGRATTPRFGQKTHRYHALRVEGE